MFLGRYSVGIVILLKSDGETLESSIVTVFPLIFKIKPVFSGNSFVVKSEFSRLRGYRIKLHI